MHSQRAQFNTYQIAFLILDKGHYGRTKRLVVQNSLIHKAIEFSCPHVHSHPLKSVRKKKTGRSFAWRSGWSLITILLDHMIHNFLLLIFCFYAKSSNENLN